MRTWRGRFAGGGLLALADRRRSGRPTRFTPVQVAEAKALACQLPAETGVPLARWSCPELADAYTAHGLRAGGATSAAKAGAPMSAITRHGRWADGSPVVAGYIRQADKWNDNPLHGIGL